MSIPAVKSSGLSKTYGEGDSEVHALRSATFEVPKGEFVVLLGPSGSGKTTLLNQVGALESPTSGDIEAIGVSLGDLDESGRTQYRLDSVGFVFQFYNLVPTLTARENVELVAELTGEGPAARTESVLSDVGLGDRLDHFPAQMSGGEQQRVSIARGLVKDPPLLLCDEPTGALDVATGKQILGLLRSTTEGEDRSVFLVTHNTEIARMADRVIRLRDGEIIDDSPNPAPVLPEHLDW
ncbi:MAG: ABC transporter ATP-binding protein [Acidimicrobiia bacterium]